jgi:transcriptional regulator with GAF, ATPase, and Fis domain
VLLAENGTLDAGDFVMLAAREAPSNQVQLPPEGIDFRKLERDLVLQALDRVDWNRTRAAELLGMRRDQIRYRIEKFGLEGTNGRSA